MRRLVFGAVGLAAVVSAVLLYSVATQTDRLVSDAQALASSERLPADPSAVYLKQMRLTQETLRSFGYAPGDINGIMRVETISALRAFQREHGLKVTGQANPETLAALGIEDRLYRRPR